MNKIIGRYRIEYENGIVQEKDLIDHIDYIENIKPIESIISELKDGPEKSKLKKEVFDMVGDNWFTNGSILWGAYESGYINLPSTQGGIQKCLITKIS